MQLDGTDSGCPGCLEKLPRGKCAAGRGNQTHPTASLGPPKRGDQRRRPEWKQVPLSALGRQISNLSAREEARDPDPPSDIP